MYRSFLSWRYLVARKSNLIGIVGILLGVGALILILSIMTGFLEEQRRTLRGSLADVIISPNQLSDPVALLTTLREDPQVAAATSQLLWGGILDHGDEPGRFQSYLASIGSHQTPLAQLVGVDSLSDMRLSLPLVQAAVGMLGGVPLPVQVFDEFDTTDFLRGMVGPPGEDGSIPWTYAPPHPLFPFQPPPARSSDAPDVSSCLIGEALARQFGLLPGDTVQLMTVVMDDNEEIRSNNRHFRVAGTFRTQENDTDRQRIYLERDELADLIGGRLGFSQALVRLKNYERDKTETLARLRDTLAAGNFVYGGEDAKRQVYTWEDLRGNLLAAIDNERTLMAIMLSLVLIVAGFTVFAILSMMVTEKRRDIGILTALGATPRGILFLFLNVAFWDALIGALLGGALGVLLAFRIDPVERWLSSTFGVEIFNRDVYLFDHIPTIVQPVAVALIVSGAFVCTHLFAALPAWRAARMDPLDALRYE